MSMRICAVMLGLCFVLATGCDKSGTTSGGGTNTSGSAPSKVGGGEDTYAKKLVGVWEGTEDLGGKSETVTIEFKDGGGFRVAMGPLEMKGTWKLVKEEGKNVTVDTEVTLEGFGDAKAPAKPDKKTILVAFEDADTVVMSKTGDKPDPKKLKRKK